jgi:threonine dehydrogenase-like Zn-dependent dehydrogenase
MRHEGEADSIKYANLIEIQSSSRHYDVMVVGCGPPGITAALFASRVGMSVLVVGSPSQVRYPTIHRGLTTFLYFLVVIMVEVRDGLTRV